MEQTILELKKLNAAYIAALEYDYCPGSEKANAVAKLFDTGVSNKVLKEALDEHSGSRPDEIAMSMTDAIKNLKA